MKRLSVLAGMAFLTLGSPAVAETIVSVASIGTGDTAEELLPRDMMNGMLTGCLSAEPSLGVAERAGLNALTGEKSLGIAGVTHGQGGSLRLLRVQYVITGLVTPLQGGWLMTLQANDPATAQTIAAHSVALVPYFYRDPAHFCAEAVTPLADKLLNHPARATDGAAEETHSEESALLLKGIAAANSGDYAHAFAPLLKLLRRDPKNADACYWLAISYAGGSMPDLAQLQADKCTAFAPDHPLRRQLSALLTPATPSHPPAETEH